MVGVDDSVPGTDFRRQLLQVESNTKVTQMAAPIPAGQFQTQKCYVSAESKAATPKLRTAAKLTQYATFQVLLDA